MKGEEAMKKFTFGWGMLLVACLVVVMCFPAWGRTIKIGVIGPMNFIQGKGHWNGAIMAAEEINAKGGVQVGKEKMKIELVKADSNEFLNVTDATNAMERLMTQDKVDFVVGGFRTEAVLAMQDIAMDYKKIFIGCGAAHPELCLRVAKDYNRYKYWFRGTPFNSNYLVAVCFAQVSPGCGRHQKRIEGPGKSGHRGRKSRLGGPHDQGGRGHASPRWVLNWSGPGGLLPWPRMSPPSFRPFRKAGPI